MSKRPFSLIVLSVLLLTALLAACSPLQKSPASAPVLNADVPTDKRSTAFVPNLGQTDPVVLFRALGSASTLFFAHHEVIFPLPSLDEAAGMFEEIFHIRNGSFLIGQWLKVDAGPMASTTGFVTRAKKLHTWIDNPEDEYFRHGAIRFPNSILQAVENPV